ncbi:MAG: hypothetical protein V7L21_09320 [Nostoc sp.]|uniref:hypothetical protein n=1 Tax=Nostoc sp. TaxID=1180 RepID=UPI002FF67F14
MPSPFYLLFRFITPESSLAIQDGDRTEVIREYQALTTIGNKYLIPNAIHQEIISNFFKLITISPKKWRKGFLIFLGVLRSEG